jgi:hypothetical protein
MIKNKVILLDILFTVLTGGLFNLWVQYRQIRDSNRLLPVDEQKSFVLLMIFSILTFGIYFVWHEFKMTRDLHLKVYGERDSAIELLCAIGTVFGLWFLVDSYQQNLLNEYVLKQDFQDR